MIARILENMSLDEFSPGAPRRVVEIFAEQHRAGSVNVQALLGGEHGEDVQQLVAEVAIQKEEPSENWEQKKGVIVPRLDENPEAVARQFMKHLKIARVKEALGRKIEEQGRAEARGEDIRGHQQEIMQMQALMNRLKKGDIIR